MSSPYPALVEHTIQRLEERYVVRCDEEDYEFLCHQIKTGNAILITRTDASRAQYYVPYLGRTIRVVWDNTIDRIVTALPLRH